MKVGICAIIRDCNENYLKEWVEYHRLIGVDYFYIYDNDSKISIRETLKDCLEYLIVYDINGDIKQLEAYNNLLDKFHKNELDETVKCDWVA